MGKLEKVGAAVVGVLLCIIIVVGLLNKNDARRDEGEMASLERNRKVAEKDAEKPKNKLLKVDDLIAERKRELERKKREEDARRKRDAAKKDGGEAGEKPGPGGKEVIKTDPVPKPPKDDPAPAGKWPRDYEIKSGDILGKICISEYGTSRMVRSVLAANPGLDPKRLRPGKTIKLPAPDPSMKGGNAGSETPVSAPGRRPSFITSSYIKRNAGGAKAAPASADVYVVQSGDTLSGIAQRKLGSIRHTRALIDANKNLLKNESTTLRIGWQLTLPKVN